MRPVLDAALPVFALILTGAVCGRSGMFDRRATDSLNRFAIYLALPALMFGATSRITPAQAGLGGFACFRRRDRCHLCAWFHVQPVAGR